MPVFRGVPVVRKKDSRKKKRWPSAGAKPVQAALKKRTIRNQRVNCEDGGEKKVRGKLMDLVQTSSREYKTE